jgi:hypothetical protein
MTADNLVRGTPQVGCYVFPHYHPNAYNDRAVAPGWTEYELVRAARPWFPGHFQPRVPVLGALDESLPGTWALYNRLASAHGIDAWIFDWYWLENQPVFHEALEGGFLPSPNAADMKFSVMLVNHDWPNWIPNVGPTGAFTRLRLAPGPNSSGEARRCLAYFLSRYCHLPNYWKLDGKPLIVIWSANPHGEAEARQLRDSLAWARKLAMELGFPGLHFHATQGSVRASPRSPYGEYPDPAALGFDSYGVYNPIVMGTWARPPSEEMLDYAAVADDVARKLWPWMDGLSQLPFFPGVSPGWDTTPRYPTPPHKPVGDRRKWPGQDTVVNETPVAFSQLVRAAATWLREHSPAPPVLTVGCWNEWTEGHYLLPDNQHGYGMLQALAHGLGIGPSAAGESVKVMELS